MSRILNVTFPEDVLYAADAEYRRRGLGTPLAGSMPGLYDTLLKGVVEAARLVPGEARAVHRYELGGHPVLGKVLAASDKAKGAPAEEP